MFDPQSIKIGIIGGGQIGKMITQAAKKLGFFVTVLDPTPNCPAGQVADKQIISDFYNKDKLRELVTESDVTTYDIEHIDVDVLKELVDKKYSIHPSPRILGIIQDKAKQRGFLARAGVPIPECEKVNTISEACSILKSFGFPVVLKRRKGGYDGQGVFIIKSKSEIKEAEEVIKEKSILEKFVDISKELALIVVRNKVGEIKCYPVVEMIFDNRANICDMVIVPARIDGETKRESEQIARKTIEYLGGVGVFGIEMFLTKKKEVLVNEIAPRPHNSGHYSIEACITSQFEQHIRAITGLPLGSTELLTPAVMVNILGAEGHEGKATFENIDKILEIPGASLHIYGKQITKPFRKMGHLTIVDKNLDKAIEKAEEAKKILRVIAK